MVRNLIWNPQTTFASAGVSFPPFSFCGNLTVPRRLTAFPLSLVFMSDNVHPPLRIVAESSRGISAGNAKKHVEAFLADYEARMVTKGGDTHVTSQLLKVKSALEKEGKKDKDEA